MKKIIGFVAVMLVLLAASLAWAAVPGKLSYEGRLTDSAGNPVTSSKTVVFTIYDAATAGTSLWTESQSVTPNNQGVFSVLLGSTSPLSPTVFNGDPRYIEITVGGETISPRSQVVSVGYALTSELAQNVANNSITRNSIAANQVVKKIVGSNGVNVLASETDGTGIVTIDVSSVVGPQGPTGVTGPQGP
ncbi:MAG TPA: hypothetical protein VMT55_01630, partial [Candidatus Sulfotelmatobacter sp.]|nr:hypothetical protein [Candidatus Sulfotelmatobacter sp.]